MTEKKQISRRELFGKLAMLGAAIGISGTATSIIGYIAYRKVNFLTKGPYSTSDLVEHMPMLKDIIIKEGEKYFSYPDSTQEKVKSLDEINDRLYPQVKNSIDDFLNETEKYPKLNELSYLNANSLMYGIIGVGWMKACSIFQKRAKNEHWKKQLKYFKYLGGAQFIAPAVAHALFRGGLYNRFNGKISIALGNSVSYTKKAIVHEIGHKLFYESVNESFPSWIPEGFAEGFSWSVLNNSRLLGETKNDVRKESLQHLVTTYKLVCKEKGMLCELPKEFDEFDVTFWRTRIPTEYSMGYTFFRIRERQKGSEIYQKILNERSLNLLEPIPNVKK